MKTMALIPARSGSKRVRDKNIRDLGGWPLMRWSIEVAKQSELFDRIVVSTDSEDYANRAGSWGAETILRPPDLARDDSTDEMALKNALQTLQDALGQDLIVYLRPTTPFRTTTLIRQAIDHMKNAGDNATSLRSIEEMEESAHKCFYWKYGYIIPIIGDMKTANAPNQMVSKTYRGNGYIDIFRVSQIMAGDIWGNRVIGFSVPRVIEIDSEHDFWLAEQWLNRPLKFEFGQEEI